MKLLPPRTELPAAALTRRHAPVPGAYPTYCACLRWEFGFSCAFCLLHESDFFVHGIEGTGLTSIEHRATQQSAKDRKDHYANCLYACRFCNGARGTLPIVDDLGRTLLEPCTSPWADHFRYEADSLQPRPGDRDAEYTAYAYDIDEPRKTTLRAERRHTIESALETLRTAPALIQTLLARAEQLPAQTMELVAAAEQLQHHITAAERQLARYLAIPADADNTCRCGEKGPRVLPQFIASQVIELNP